MRAATVLGGDLGDLREQNVRRLLELLSRQAHGLTKGELQEQSGLAHGTVHKLINDLHDERVVAGLELPAAGRGRPAQCWTLRPDAAFAVGIDIGREHVSVAMVDSHGNRANDSDELREEFLTLPDRERTLDVAVALLKRCVGSEERCERIAALAVSLPGPVAENAMYSLGLPEWELSSLRSEIIRRWGTLHPPTIFFDNDANVAAEAELQRSDNVRDDFLFVKWSSGIGGAVVLNGQIWRGRSGIAGELGHIKVLVDADAQGALRLPPGSWPMCPRCQQIDCIDVLVGARSLCRAAGVPDVERLSAAARDGEERAIAVLATAGRLVGRALGPALTLLDVGKVVVGGSVGREALDELESHLRRGISDSAPSEMARATQIIPTTAGPDSTATGAALSALDRNGVDFLLETRRTAALRK